MRIDVALTPALVSDAERSICIVVDVLRASTACLAMFESGIESIAVAASPEAARSLRDERMTDALLCGESGGLPPPGFDYGNSPVEFTHAGLSGRRAVLATSNGTRALHAVAAAPSVLVGCLRNRLAVAQTALTEAWGGEADGVLVICAGNAYGATFSLDDAVTAGAIVSAIRQPREFGSGNEVPAPSDAAMAAEHLFAAYASNPLIAFRESSHGRVLQTLGFADDLDYCAAVDRSSTVPYLTREDGELLVLRSRMVQAKTFD